MGWKLIAFEYHGKLIAIEIKSTTTLRKDLFNNLIKWQHLSNMVAENCKLIYAGSENHTLLNIDAIAWQNIEAIFRDPLCCAPC